MTKKQAQNRLRSISAAVTQMENGTLKPFGRRLSMNYTWAKIVREQNVSPSITNDAHCLMDRIEALKREKAG